ncbi:MAG: hypothetical protein QUV05_00195 [Phycisphaerae bacterium]|nr:hypothetical protein [Phycisphaerae bacterium]
MVIFADTPALYALLDADDANHAAAARARQTWLDVDAVSFEVMRRRGISAAFTFDPHFEDERFERLP